MTAQILGTLATAAAPYVAQGIGNLFSAGGNAPTYSTQQSDQAMRDNDAYTSGKSRDQMGYENQLYGQRADSDLNRTIAYNTVMGNQANAAANANTGRNFAANAQNTLNSQYASAGDRLGRASANTQQALNNAAQTVAGMFR